MHCLLWTTATLQGCTAEAQPCSSREQVQRANTLSKTTSYWPTLQKITCLFLKPAQNLDSNTLDCCAALFSIECLDLGNMALIKNGQPTNCTEFSHNCLAKKELQQLLAIHQNFCLVAQRITCFPIYTWEMGCSKLPEQQLPQHRKKTLRDPKFHQLQLLPLPGINSCFVSADVGLQCPLLHLLFFFLRKPKINIVFEWT